jgi:hypothetical protein
MKTTLCFLDRAHFSIFPRLAHNGQHPTCDTTVAHPRRTPSPIFTRLAPRLRCAWVGAMAGSPFLLHAPSRSAPTPTPLKSSLCHFEKGPLHRLRSLSPFPLPRVPQATLCLSLHASCPGSTAANSASLVSAPRAPPFFDPSGPTPTPSPPLAAGAHRSHRRPPEYLRC